MQDGATLTTSGGLTNGLYVDNGGSGGSSLSIGGTLTNSATVQIGDGIGVTTVSAMRAGSRP